MSVVKLIESRRSVRSYTGELLSAETITEINAYLKELSAPFGAEIRIELISAMMGDEPVKLGTYGVIRGASHFLALIVKEGELADVSGGYVLEQVVLYCTQMELGTCWLGGTFKAKDFLEHIQLRENEKLPIICAIGYPAEKRRILDSIFRASAGSNNRKAFEQLFFNKSFATPLSREEASKYKVPLGMLRLAPSASNKQPWRVLKDGNSFHFYHRPNHFSLNDMGIALCHFELTCKELGIKGHLEVLEDISDATGMKYLISWISE